MGNTLDKKDLSEIKKALVKIQDIQDLILFELFGDDQNMGLSDMVTDVWEKLFQSSWKEGYEAGRKDGFK